MAPHAPGAHPAGVCFLKSCRAWGGALGTPLETAHLRPFTQRRAHFTHTGEGGNGKIAALQAPPVSKMRKVKEMQRRRRCWGFLLPCVRPRLPPLRSAPPRLRTRSGRSRRSRCRRHRRRPLTFSTA
eukprot:gene23305-biopygen10327